MVTNEIVTERLSERELAQKLVTGSIDENWKLVLRPNWILRKDKKRIILVEIVEKIFEVGKHNRLTPQTGILLSFLDGHRTLADLKNEGMKLFDMPEAVVWASITEILKNAYSAFSFYDGTQPVRSYDARDFIIPANEIDLQSSRMYNPLMMVLHVADSCIRNCIYCNVQKRPRHKNSILTTEEIFKIIDQAKDLGILTISIAGGEPFIRNDIVEIVEHIRNHGMYWGISTKAFISEQLAERLKNAGVEYMQVSIDAPTEEVADFMAGSVGFFKDAIQSIKNLRQAGIQVRTNSVLTPFNVRLFPQLVELLSSLGVYFISSTTAGRSSYNGAIADSLFLNHREGKWLEQEIRRLRENNKNKNVIIKDFIYQYDYSWKSASARKKRFDERAGCGAGHTYFVLAEDGTVTWCEECPIVDELIIGNVRESSLEEIWNSPKGIEFLHPPRDRYKGTVCFDCSEYDECHQKKGRCWRESLKAYDKIYAPAPACPKAPKGKRIY